jgi:hypothetical protein
LVSSAAHLSICCTSRSVFPASSWILKVNYALTGASSYLIKCMSLSMSACGDVRNASGGAVYSWSVCTCALFSLPFTLGFRTWFVWQTHSLHCWWCDLPLSLRCWIRLPLQIFTMSSSGCFGLLSFVARSCNSSTCKHKGGMVVQLLNCCHSEWGHSLKLLWWSHVHTEIEVGDTSEVLVNIHDIHYVPYTYLLHILCSLPRGVTPNDVHNVHLAEVYDCVWHGSNL